MIGTHKVLIDIAADNLYPNPSFEADTANVYAQAPTIATNPVMPDAPDGTRVLRLTPILNDWALLVALHSTPFPANTHYSVRLTARLIGGTGSRLLFSDLAEYSGGAHIGAGVGMGEHLTLTPAWGEYVIEGGPSRPNCDRIDFYLNSEPSSWSPGEGVEIDRVQITGTATAPAYSLDISCWLDSVDIRHGRDEPTGQPEASSATFDFTTQPALPDEVEIGAAITVKTRVTDGTEFIRFTGRISDISLGWDDAGPNTPDAGIGQMVAVGTVAELGRRVVGDEPFPQERDGVRVSRVAALAGFTIDPAFSDEGTVDIRPRDIDSRAALEVMHDAAQSAGGMVWASRAGDIRYADAEHRRNMTPALTLDACDILVTPSWVRNVGGLINAVSIGYGVPPEGGEEPRYVAEHPASIAKWGLYAYSTGTELAALADAQAMGNLILVRNNRPVWNLNAIPIDVKSLSDADYKTLLSLDVHSLIQITGLPAIGSAPTSFPTWVEGWRETLAYGTHDIEITVSDYCRTSPPTRWNDLVLTLTWDTALGTWDDASCYGPVADIGRWDDISASVRWDNVPTDITWDTYTTSPAGRKP